MNNATTNTTITQEITRKFVPNQIDLGDWNQLLPLFENLRDREIHSAEDLEKWLYDLSELASCISEERALRYIGMTCHTEDSEKENAYLHFIENIDPKCQPFWHQLNEKYYNNPHRANLPKDRYEVLDRNIAAEIEIYREENIPLQTEEKKKSQAYQKICGAMTVEFQGKEYTMPQMGKFLEENDRSLRKNAWEAVSNRRLRERAEIDSIYNTLVQIRHQIAQNADFKYFRDYAFLYYKRFDYTPKECEAFQQAVEEHVVPLMRQVNERRREQMGLDTLRPWDIAVDPKGRPPLRPFETSDQLCDGVERMLRHVSSDLADQFVEMRQSGDLDLDSRKGKAPGGYQYSLDERRRPFIFMNAAGLQRDVETLLHESGHAFHCLATRDEPLIDYRDSPIEFAEVASMAMELFAADAFTEFYKPENAARAKRKHLEGILGILPWIARIDAFQHWIYTHPHHSTDERTAQWLELDERYGSQLDWMGYENQREALWQRQLHLFVHPFYYIEYGIAQLGALQLWINFLDKPKETIDRYLKALSLGGSRPLPELFETAGAKFDFSAETINPLMNRVKEELDKISE